MKRFIITITNYHWSCGDGCCSDSGYKLYVEDTSPLKKGYGHVTSNSYWDNNRSPKPLMESAIESISEVLGRLATKDDYTVIEDDVYSDDETFE